MKTPPHAGLRLVATIAGAASAALLGFGCGDDDGFPKRFPVSGTVTYKGKPVPRGKIEFIPTTPPPSGHPASGTITDGSFSVTTHTTDDGAVPGRYKVTVVAREYDPKMKKALEAEAGGGYAHLGSRVHVKAQRTAKNLAPVKYGRTATTDLTAEIKEQSNHFEFELKD
jgi:hypothetical protein